MDMWIDMMLSRLECQYDYLILKLQHSVNKGAILETQMLPRWDIVAGVIFEALFSWRL